MSLMTPILSPPTRSSRVAHHLREPLQHQPLRPPNMTLSNLGPTEGTGTIHILNGRNTFVCPLRISNWSGMLYSFLLATTSASDTTNRFLLHSVLVCRFLNRLNGHAHAPLPPLRASPAGLGCCKIPHHTRPPCHPHFCVHRDVIAASTLLPCTVSRSVDLVA